MIFDDTQIRLRIEAAQGFCRDGAPAERNRKFLLIHGCGGEHGCLHAPAEPFRHRTRSRAESLHGFALVGGALRGAVAEGQHAYELFPGREGAAALGRALAEPAAHRNNPSAPQDRRSFSR